MQKFYKALLVVLLFILSKITLQANLIAGGNISYRAVDSVNYLITTRIFVLCGDSTFTPFDSLTISYGNTTYKMGMLLQTVTDVTGTYYNCPTGSKCNGTGMYGVKEYLYTNLINLSGSNCEVTVGWQGNNRYSNITTGQADKPTYIYALINRCVINNSVHPTLTPHFINQVGQDLSMSVGFIDTIDNDSMGFRLIAPLIGPNSAANYSGSWSPSRPLSFLGFPNTGLNSPAGFHFDSTTSQLSFRPTKQSEAAIICIEATEYRLINGTMAAIGKTIMEHLVMIFPTPNNKTPKLAGLPTFGVCAGKEICIPFTSTDADTDDTLRMEWNGGIKNATFTINQNGKRPTGTFCWTPTQADIRNWPHYFTVRVNDDECGPNAKTTRVLGITVYPEPDSAFLEIEKKEVKCSQFLLKMKRGANSTVKRNIVTTGGTVLAHSQDSVLINFDSSGWFPYTVTTTFNNSCSFVHKDSVFIQLPYHLTINKTADTSVCPADTFTLNISPKIGTPPYTHQWAPINHLGTSYQTAITQPKTYIIYTTDSMGCFVIDTIKAGVYVKGKVTITCPDSVCSNHTPYAIAGLPAGGQWIAPIGSIVGDSLLPQMALIGRTKIHYETLDSNGCAVKDSTTVVALQAPAVSFITDTLYGHPPVQVSFEGTATPKALRWRWELFTADSTLADTTIVGDSMYKHTFIDTGKYAIRLTAYTSYCQSTTVGNQQIIVGPLASVKPTGASKLNVYPNPAKNAFTVELLNGETIKSITVTDITGKTINGVMVTGNNVYLQNVEAGVYLLIISTDSNTLYKASLRIE